MKFRSQLPWIITAISLTAALCSLLSLYFNNDSETVSERFPTADGFLTRAEHVDLSPDMRLKLRYSPIADNGVEIEMLFHHRRAWTAYVERLGTAHSAYSHSVECGLDNGALYIKSIGSAGDVYERRNPQTGQLLHRLVAPKSIEDNR